MCRLGEGYLGDNEEGDEKENEKPNVGTAITQPAAREAETTKQRGGSPQRRIVVYLLQAAQVLAGAVMAALRRQMRRSMSGKRAQTSALRLSRVVPSSIATHGPPCRSPV